MGSIVLGTEDCNKDCDVKEKVFWFCYTLASLEVALRLFYCTCCKSSTLIPYHPHFLLISSIFWCCHPHFGKGALTGLHVAIQNDTTKRWDIYGVITEIGPHRRYYVKTTSGRVLTRNRRFLRRRVPWSPPPTSRPEDRSTHTGDRSTRPGYRSTRRSTRPRNPPAPPPTQRSSQRRHNKPKRLIEEITFK